MNTADRCYVLTRHMLTDPLKDITIHMKRTAQESQALDEAFAALERQLADLQADRDAAWRMAHGAAAGHEHAQALLKKIADVFGRTDGFDELPAMVRKQGETANVHRDVSRMIDSMLRVFEQAGLTGPLDECARALVNDRAKLRVENEILRRDLADSKTREHAMTVDADRRNGLESDLATSRDRAKRLKKTLTNVNARASDLAGELDTSREKVTRLEAISAGVRTGMAKTSDSDERLWRALEGLDDDLLDPALPEFIVDEQLKAMGIDPVSFARTGGELVAKAKEAERLSWQTRARR